MAFEALKYCFLRFYCSCSWLCHNLHSRTVAFLLCLLVMVHVFKLNIILSASKHTYLYGCQLSWSSSWRTRFDRNQNAFLMAHRMTSGCKCLKWNDFFFPPTHCCKGHGNTMMNDQLFLRVITVKHKDEHFGVLGYTLNYDTWIWWSVFMF